MRRRKYTKQILEQHVQAVQSWGALIRSFGLSETGGNYVSFQRRCKEFEVSTSHFKGQGWSLGLTQDTDERVATVTAKISYTTEQILVENSPSSIRSCRLKSILKKKHVLYKCSIPECGISEWLGQPLTLHLDHINGVNNDNRLENLRYLCPNCHQQTPTWGSKNHKH